MVPVNTSGILPSLVVDDLTAITAPLSAWGGSLIFIPSTRGGADHRSGARRQRHAVRQQPGRRLRGVYRQVLELLAGLATKRRIVRFDLELPQVLPQRRARVLGAHGASLLEQRSDLIHEGPRRSPARCPPDGEAVAPTASMVRAA
jgi:hypothetical protein